LPLCRIVSALNKHRSRCAAGVVARCWDTPRLSARATAAEPADLMELRQRLALVSTVRGTHPSGIAGPRLGDHRSRGGRSHRSGAEVVDPAGPGGVVKG